MPSPNGSSATSSVSPASVGGIAQYLIYGEKWGGGLGSGFTLTYSFPGAAAVYTSGYGAGEPASDSPFSAADQTAATAALMAWAAAANVRFQQVTET
ncbi:MAG: hypothetical protein ABWZ40_05555, partial [Caulobacterales bacterium]